MQKKMKLFKKILCLALAVTMLAAVCIVFDSCKEEDKGRLLATYKGGEIYEKEIEDWQNYFLIQSINDVAGSDDYVKAINEINDSTTVFVAQYKAFEQLLNDEGILALGESEIKTFANQLIAEFDKQFADVGGYGYWKKTYGVSDKFIYDFAEEQLVLAYLEDYVMKKYGITDELIYDYWEKHATDYLTVPSYKFDVIMVAVAEKDRANESAWEEAKMTAESYVTKLKGGENFVAVKNTAIANSKNPEATRAYSVNDSLPIADCRGFENLEENLTALDGFVENLENSTGVKYVEYADPNGNVQEYSFWFQVCNMYNELYTKNALLNMEIGDTISFPIRHIIGYEIIKLTAIDTTTAFRNPKDDPEVYDEIYNSVYDELWADGEGAAAEAFIKQLTQDYEINVTYSYVEGAGETSVS